MDSSEVTPIIDDRKQLFGQWYSRLDWGAQRPRLSEQAKEPVSRVFFHFNTGTPPCYGAKECIPALRELQTIQIRKDMNDIAYNFMVASGGNIYEGRGFGVVPSAQLRYAYGDRLDIGFIGQWTLKTLPYNMFKTGMKLLELGIENGFVKQQWTLQAVIPKEKKDKLELQMQRFLKREENKKPKKKPKWQRYGRRRNFHGKHHIRQYIFY